MYFFLLILVPISKLGKIENSYIPSLHPTKNDFLLNFHLKETISISRPRPTLLSARSVAELCPGPLCGVVGAGASEAVQGVPAVIAILSLSVSVCLVVLIVIIVRIVRIVRIASCLSILRLCSVSVLPVPLPVPLRFSTSLLTKVDVAAGSSAVLYRLCRDAVEFLATLSPAGAVVSNFQSVARQDQEGEECREPRGGDPHHAALSVSLAVLLWHSEQAAPLSARPLRCTVGKSVTLTDISSTVEKQVTLVAKAVTLTDFFCTVAKQLILA